MKIVVPKLACFIKLHKIVLIKKKSNKNIIRIKGLNTNRLDILEIVQLILILMIR